VCRMLPRSGHVMSNTCESTTMSRSPGAYASLTSSSRQKASIVVPSMATVESAANKPSPSIVLTISLAVSAPYLPCMCRCGKGEDTTK
jgi:hypothetical protein